VLGLRASIERLDAWAGPQELVLSGGLARSEAWRRLLSEILGRALAPAPSEEVSARGAALWALERLS
jgi:sugar (pentulose or hexulose) kinase